MCPTDVGVPSDTEKVAQRRDFSRKAPRGGSSRRRRKKNNSHPRANESSQRRWLIFIQKTNFFRFEEKKTANQISWLANSFLLAKILEKL